ncbi:ATP-binding protein [Halobacteriaceae archaeon GCM10025711]
MTRVIGRRESAGATGPLGRYVARDGSDGVEVALDLERPHAGLVVGKRGTGKSYTLGVLAENLADAPGVTGVVADPMGVFAPLATEGAARLVATPQVAADALPPPAWCDLFGVDPTSPVGSLLWRAAAETTTLAGMRSHVETATVRDETRRAALNYLDLAASWSVFDPDGVTARDLLAADATVLDLSGLDAAPMNAVVRAVAAALYRVAVAERVRPLPWLLVDEAHAFVDAGRESDASASGAVADPALRRLLTRGRTPGVSVVLATQRPSALPAVAVSQADLLVAHRLTAQADVDALARARPTYLAGPSLAERLPDETGVAVVVDDTTERVHTVRVRERRTSHGGRSPRASESETAE